MRVVLRREASLVDLTAVKYDGDLACTWCDLEPTHRASWPGYEFGELVCMTHAERLDGYGARIRLRSEMAR